MLCWDESDVVRGAGMARQAVAEAVAHLQSAATEDWSDGGADNYLAARDAALGTAAAVQLELEALVRVARSFAQEAAAWDGMRSLVG